MYPREQYLKEIISKKDNGRIIAEAANRYCCFSCIGNGFWEKV